MEATVEHYERFEIEWVSMSSIGTCGHGIELHYDDGKHQLRVGFIDGYGWFHQRKGPCKVLTLSPDSQEWADLASISDIVLSDLQESVHVVLRDKRIYG